MSSSNSGKTFKSIMSESAVGKVGRTSGTDAERFIEENPDVILQFRALIKKVGGKTVAKRIMDLVQVKLPQELKIHEAQGKKPEELLRNKGFKIKLVTPTSFGTQIELSKKYEDAEVKELLKDFTIKIKGKSVFIVE
jgi:hypothetical protein